MCGSQTGFFFAVTRQQGFGQCFARILPGFGPLALLCCSRRSQQKSLKGRQVRSHGFQRSQKRQQFFGALAQRGGGSTRGPVEAGPAPTPGGGTPRPTGVRGARAVPRAPHLMPYRRPGRRSGLPVSGEKAFPPEICPSAPPGCAVNPASGKTPEAVEYGTGLTATLCISIISVDNYGNAKLKPD